MKIEIWFVRHAESAVNVDPDKFKNIFVGCAKLAELTDKGREQSEALGQLLKKEEFDGYFSSNAIRAMNTAKISLRARGISDIKVYQELRELDHGGREGTEKKGEKPSDGNWWNFIPAGGFESQELAFSRLKKWIEREIIIPGREMNKNLRFLIFSHGNIIRSFRAGILDLDRNQAFSYRLKHTGIVILQYEIENDVWVEIQQNQ